MTLKRRVISLSVLISLLIIVSAQANNAQEMPSKTEKPSLRDLFIDNDDGMLDFSVFLGTAKGFIPIGSIITEPAVGYGGALGLAFFHDSIKNRAQKMKELTPDGRTPRLQPPSISGIYGIGTENGTWGAGLFHFGVWKEDRIRYLGAGGYVSVNMDFYGIGDDPQLPIDSLSYSLDGGGLLQRITFRIVESDVFIEAKYSWAEIETTLDDDEAIVGLPEKQVVRTGGAALVVEYDTRNVIFTPDSGVNAKLEIMHYADFFGGDDQFTIGELNVRTWIPIKGDWVLGLRADGDVSDGGTPFYMVPSVKNQE